MSRTDYTNSSQQRILKLVLAMFGDVVNGYSPGQLCQITGHRPDAMTRDLHNLITAGLAERDEDGRYLLTTRLPQQTAKVYAAMGRSEARVGNLRSAIQRNDSY